MFRLLPDAYLQSVILGSSRYRVTPPLPSVENTKKYDYAHR